MDVLHRAGTYLRLHARLIDRLRFEALFADGSRDRVLDALRCYQNPDGGFGNALEPDLRGAGSQPEPVEVAFWILDELDELDAFADPMVTAACDYLLSVTTEDGGVPFVLPSVRDTPTAPWWETADDPPGNLIPTASLAGLLHKHGITHPWRGPATDFCWRAIAALDKPSPYEARAVATFLDLVPDRARAQSEFDRLKDGILAPSRSTRTRRGRRTSRWTSRRSRCGCRCSTPRCSTATWTPSRRRSRRRTAGIPTSSCGPRWWRTNGAAT